MRVIIICLLLLISCRLENKTKSEKMSIETLENPDEKIHFTNEDTIYYHFNKIQKQSHTSDWDVGFRIKKQTIGEVIKIEEYFYNKTIPIKDAILKRKGYVVKFDELDIVKSGATGQWFIYDDNGSLHQIGNYKNGYKDGIWYTIYEDSAIPKIEYFEKGNKQQHQGLISIKDEEGREWIKGSKVNLKGIPEGKWIVYNYNDNESYVSKYITKDTVINNELKIFDLKTNKLIRSEEFFENIDLDIYKN